MLHVNSSFQCYSLPSPHESSTIHNGFLFKPVFYVCPTSTFQLGLWRPHWNGLCLLWWVTDFVAALMLIVLIGTCVGCLGCHSWQKGGLDMVSPAAIMPLGTGAAAKTSPGSPFNCSMNSRSTLPPPIRLLPGRSFQVSCRVFLSHFIT